MKRSEASDETWSRVFGYIGMFTGIGVVIFLILMGLETFRK
jgi:hypothetical protein